MRNLFKTARKFAKPIYNISSPCNNNYRYLVGAKVTVLSEAMTSKQGKLISLATEQCLMIILVGSLSVTLCLLHRTSPAWLTQNLTLYSYLYSNEHLPRGKLLMVYVLSQALLALPLTNGTDDNDLLKTSRLISSRI